MSVLVEAIATEVAEREERQGSLQAELERIRGELTTLDEQLEQLHTMAEQAQNLNGGGPGIAPPPVEPGRPAAAKGDRGSTSPGRKGGDAPDGRRSDRRSGSAPSRPSRPSGASNTQSEDGGTKRAAVLAYVHANGRVKVIDVAQAVGVSPGAVRQHLKTLVDAGAIQAEGATSARVYFTTSNGDQQTAAKARDKQLLVTDKKIAAVKDLIARNPGKLDEQRIAYFAGLDREVVADICGRLLEDNELLLAPDGTYTIDRGGVAESVDTMTGALAEAA